MSIIDPNDIRDNIQYLTENKSIQTYIRSLTNDQIIACFDEYVDYDGIAHIRNDAVEDCIYDLEKNYNQN